MVAPTTTNGASQKLQREPLVYSGSLDSFDYFEVTPIIGREYPTLNVRTDLVELTDETLRDRRIKDLAIVISYRGVVFLRGQANLTLEQQKWVTDKLGALAGRPEGHGLHRHPLFYSPLNSTLDEKGGTDPEVYVISSETQAKLYKDMKHHADPIGVKDASDQWHSDCHFEECPADYSFLRLHQTPRTGGDTMWASGCEMYDRASPAFREFLCTLKATCSQPIFKISATKSNVPIMEPRGSPLNVGDEFAPHHPVVRTNPVTGYRSIYTLGLHVNRIDNVTSYEDYMIRDYLLRLLTRNHDLQCRIKWGNDNSDVAIWDNRSVFHSATPDMNVLGGVRTGNRASSIGEKPYLDPASKSRRETLAAGGLSV